MEFLMILLLFLFLVDVARAPTSCSVIADLNQKCCENNKPLSCLFTRSKDAVCDCHPRDKQNREVSKECLWNTFHKGPYLDCDMCGNLKSDDNPLFCPGKRYPIREIDRSDNAPHCAMSALNHQNIYDVVITCWLYDCEPRLRIPKATIQMNVMDKNKNLLCYPQIMYAGSKLEFCQRYTTIRMVTVDKRDGTDSDRPEKRGNHKECVLPPICDANGKINSKEYMFPLINKKGESKLDPSYCEKLCPENENNGKNNTCRIIPSCDPQDAYNYFKVPKCLPWCTEEDSYTRDPAKRGRICNPWPICNKDGKAEEPYSATNPYGARENECMKIGKCRGDWTEDTHFCTGDPSGTKESGLLANSETVLIGFIVFAAVVSVCLLILCIAVGIIASKVLWKKKREKPVDDEEKCDTTTKTITEPTKPKLVPFLTSPKTKCDRTAADIPTITNEDNNKTASAKDFVFMFPSEWNNPQEPQDEKIKDEQRTQTPPADTPEKEAALVAPKSRFQVEKVKTPAKKDRTSASTPDKAATKSKNGVVKGKEAIKKS